MDLTSRPESLEYSLEQHARIQPVALHFQQNVTEGSQRADLAKSVVVRHGAPAAGQSSGRSSCSQHFEAGFIAR